MENNKHSITCPNCGHNWDNKRTPLNIPKRIPRGKRKLPRELIIEAKITEGRNTLLAIAKAYGIQQSHLSEVISGKRNTKRLIEILEFEYKMPIETIRSFIVKQKEGERLNIDTYLKMKEEGAKHE